MLFLFLGNFKTGGGEMQFKHNYFFLFIISFLSLHALFRILVGDVCVQPLTTVEVLIQSSFESGGIGLIENSK